MSGDGERATPAPDGASESGLEKLRAYVERRVVERNEPLRAADEIPMRPARLLVLIAEAERDSLYTRKALYDEIKEHTRTKMERGDYA